MPGNNNNQNALPDAMSAWAKLRSALAASDNADPTLQAPALYLDMSKSIFSLTNNINIVPFRTSGTGTLSCKLWVLLPNLTTWIQFSDLGVLTLSSLKQVANLPAGKYALLFTLSVPGDNFDVWTTNSIQNIYG